MTGYLFSEETVADGSPNAGIKDMIKVLEWVQEHISKCKYSSMVVMSGNQPPQTPTFSSFTKFEAALD
jgi:hypothetical protein